MVDDGLDLYPLDEFVNGNQKVVEPHGCLPKFSNHVEAPDHKGTGDEDHLECLHQQVVLLGIVLAPVAHLDDVPGIGEGYRLVEAMPEGLPNEGTQSSVMRADASMDVVN